MKDSNNNQSRRQALKTMFATGSLMAFGSIAKTQTAEACGPLTPAQPKGPFYPIASQIDTDTDLTRIQASAQVAQGRVITIKGIVQDEACKPLAEAIVEIWQACHSGRYNHPGDPNNAPLDPHFQYWGIAKTNAKGEYSFKTVLPGAYPADAQWMRPPHVHFKVNKWGYQELVTQLYFEGEKFNDSDLYIKALSPAQRALVVRPITKVETRQRVSEVVSFPLVLKR
ncbi:MAG: protocatechuate 3,4-dioxygenase [Bdellovibrionota bacterium]